MFTIISYNFSEGPQVDLVVELSLYGNSRLQYWRISGSNFGNVPGVVLLKDPNENHTTSVILDHIGPILKWTDSEIEVAIPVIPKNGLIYVVDHQGAVGISSSIVSPSFDLSVIGTLDDNI